MGKHRILPAGAVLPPMPGQAPTAPDNMVPAAVAPAGDTATGAGAAAVSQAATAKPQPQGRRARPVSAPERPGRFRVLNEFVDGQMRDMSAAAAKAWFVLYRDTKPDGLAKTGLSDMAARMGCSGSTAKRAVQELRKSGLVTLERKGAPGRGPNVYRVHGTPRSV